MSSLWRCDAGFPPSFFLRFQSLLFLEPDFQHRENFSSKLFKISNHKVIFSSHTWKLNRDRKWIRFQQEMKKLPMPPPPCCDHIWQTWPFCIHFRYLLCCCLARTTWQDSRCKVRKQLVEPVYWEAFALYLLALNVTNEGVRWCVSTMTLAGPTRSAFFYVEKMLIYWKL